MSKARDIASASPAPSTVSPIELGFVDGVTSPIQTQIDAKAFAANLSNVDNTSDVNKPISTATQTALNLKANIASPTFTGIPLAPTATAGTNTTQIATTAFVGTAVSNLVASAPTTLDTLNELASALGNDASFSTTVTNSIAAKAPIASPTFTGTVTSTARTNFGANAYIQDAQDANWGFLYKPSQNGSAGAHGFLTSAGALLTRIDGSGNLTTSGNVTAYSDERLKSNIKTIENALEKVSKLRGVSFDKNGKNEIGVIAQEVREVLPEVVMDGEYLSVAYGNIVGLLIEAIKEQQEQIEDLKSRLAQ